MERQEVSMQDLEKQSLTVSVCMIAYNHESYIEQAVEGVLMQKTNFPVVLIVGEDCSTDGTRAILCRYADRYPDRIRLLLPAHNQGLILNFYNTVRSCHGKYVALCDSDDFWTDPYKLQKQVEYLEAHPECAICHHPALIYKTGDQTFQKPRYRYAKPIAGLEDLLLHSLLQTSTVMFRNGLIKEFPDFYFKTIFNDWTLHILNAQHGKIGFIDETMAVYRAHPDGIWTSRSNLNKCHTMVDFYFLLQSYFGAKYTHIIEQGLSREYVYLSAIYADLGNISSAKHYLNESIRTKFPLREKWIDQLVMLGRLYLPYLYRLVKTSSLKKAE